MFCDEGSSHTYCFMATNPNNLHLQFLGEESQLVLGISNILVMVVDVR